MILCLALGKTEHELLKTMSSVELTKWMALYSIEPFGDHRADMRMGITTALIANIKRNETVKPDPFLPSDFMPFMKKPEIDLNTKIKNVLSRYRK